MRILSHRAAVLLLLTALPHLLADEPSSSPISEDDAKNNDFVDPIDREDHENQEHNISVDTIEDGASSRQDKESLEQPRVEDHRSEQQKRDEHIINPSRYYKEQQDDDEIIETKVISPAKEHSSSSATSDTDNDVVDDGEKNELHHESQKMQEEDTDEVDTDESATQAVHEDGFRLPPLAKTEIAAKTDCDESGNNDNGSVVKNEQSDVGVTPPIVSQSIIEKTKGDSLVEGDQESRHDDASINDINYDGEEEEEKPIKVVNTAEQLDITVVASGSDSMEVEDEEVVLVKTAKFAVGTTSVDSLEENVVDADVDIDDSMVANNDAKETPDEGDSSTDGETDESVENVTIEIPEQEADDNTETGEGDPSVSDRDEEIVDSEVNEAVDSNTSVGQNVEDSGDVVESSDNETVTTEDEKEETEVEIEADDEDEDLSDRVLVDYASKSAGALIVEKTNEFKGTSNLITGNRDKYAIVPCSEEKKYFVLSLSEDILVKEIKLANYERFSSTVKDFQVKGSSNLGKWFDLGTYKAEPGHGEQTFVMKDPTWARYLKFKFLTYHGFEHYCTLSQIKVHGSNMVQGFHEQWDSIEESNDEQADDDVLDDTAEKPTADSEDETKVNAKHEENEEEIESEGNSINSSKSGIEDPKVSTNLGDLDAVEKVHPSSSSDDSASSIDSKPEPLAKFRTPTAFSEILEGEMVDENLFADIYDLIPKTIRTLPAHSKNDVGGKSEDSELRSVHQIGQLAIESLYSIGSQIVDDIAEMVTEENETDAIVSPKMNDLDDDYLQKKFGSGLSSMMKLTPPMNLGHSLPPVESSHSEAPSEGNDEATHRAVEAPQDTAAETTRTENSTRKEETSTPSEKEVVEEINDPVNLALAKVLKDLPSAECLVNLDFAEFKSKISATRKSTGAAGGSQGGRMAEPIFKKLTDEIFALQTSLSVHDQFAKLSVGCYQRVILDLTMETEKLRRDQEERLARLEEQMLEPANMRMFNKLFLSLLSTFATWSIAIASHLFLTITGVWIPAILQSLLSETNYDTSARISRSLFDRSSTVIGYVSATLESNEWSRRVAQQTITACQELFSTITQGSRFQGLLSAWSSFYDGGMTVVALVLVIVLGRAMTRSVRKKEQIVRRPTRTKKSDPPPSAQNSFTSFHENSSQSFQEPPAAFHSDEIVPTPSSGSVASGQEPPASICHSNHEIIPTGSITSSVSSNKKKRKSRKTKKQNNSNNNNDNDKDNGTIVDRISLKSSEEGVPELDDELLRDRTDNTPDAERPNSPSMVSLDE